MDDLNILICEGNTPEEGKIFQDVGIPTHTESLKESLSYFNKNLKIDVLNPCLKLINFYFFLFLLHKKS